jgi:NAD(P)-dependent dehydrogenase (short-subunit alcohol dehydrogenase family)
VERAVIRFLITGHSRGLGAALAREALARGGAVWGLARRSLSPPPGVGPERFRETAIDLGDLTRLVRVLEDLDLETWLAGSAMVVLINNAGLLGPVGPPERLAATEIVRAAAVDFVAPLVLTSVFARVTVGLPDRRVAHVSSGAARRPLAGWSVYGAVKAGLDQHARTAAVDASAGWRIASVAPGVIDTDMQTEVRGLDPAVFPERRRFLDLAREGLLVSPEVAAQRFLDYVTSDVFGREPTIDLRSLGENTRS